MMKILLTAFETFGNHEVNPTIAVVKELQTRRAEDIETLILDVGYEIDGETVVNKIKEMSPDLVLSFGLAGGRKRICFEAVALNVRHSFIQDNQGLLYTHQKISSGDLAYLSNLDFKNIEKMIADELFGVSYHAGTFVCNDVYYQELEYIFHHHLDIKCGFIHIPYVQEFTKEIPSIPFEKMIKIIMKVMDYIIESMK